MDEPIKRLPATTDQGRLRAELGPGSCHGQRRYGLKLSAAA